MLWKNRQYAANRMRYTGGASQVDAPTGLTPGTRGRPGPGRPRPTRPALARYEATFARFCATFPDAFFVSERARVYLDPKKEKQNAGRLLSAGFHSMTGYFRDDAPLYELMLDRAGPARARRALAGIRLHHRRPDAAVHELHLVRAHRLAVHARPRVRLRPRRGQGRDVRGQDRRLAEVYLAKARDNGASDVALEAIEDHFQIISASIRWVEQARQAAEPGHVAALQAFAERAYRRPLSAAGTRRRRRVLPRAARAGRPGPRGRRARHDRQRADVAPLLLPRSTCPSAGTGVRPLSDYALASRLSYFLWSSMPDEELLARAAAGDLHRPEVLVAQARRMLRDDRVRGLATEFGGNWLDFRRFEEHNSVDRERFPSFDDDLRRGDVRGAGPVLHRPRPRGPLGARLPLRATTRSSTRSSPGTTACPTSRASGPTSGCGSTTPAATGAAGCCRWRSS